MIKVKLIISGVISLALCTTLQASDFCDGFAQGYKSGYKQASGSGINPIVPVCPVKPIKGLSDPQSDYEFGYTVGYREAISNG